MGKIPVVRECGVVIYVLWEGKWVAVPGKENLHVPQEILDKMTVKKVEMKLRGNE